MIKRSLPPTASVAQSREGKKLHAPAAARNADSIADLLARIAPDTGQALELASGTGQHVVAFAKRMPQLVWQPTEVDPERLDSIAAYTSGSGLSNVLKPRRLDATATQWVWPAEKSVDLMVLVNLLHLISADETKTLLSNVATALSPDGTFVVYGPFKRAGQLISEGDERFHSSLVASDPSIGYKNDTDLKDWLGKKGLRRVKTVNMPANNLAMIARLD